jgi:carbonic anhydrase
MTTDRRIVLPVALALVLPLAACGPADTETETETDAADAAAREATWSYSGQTGPESWGELSEDYATCETGESQSPINVVPGEATEAELPPLEFAYGSAEFSLEDTGYSYKATPSGEHTLTVGEDSYRLLQFHEHTPSEHDIAGDSFPMEVHFVHQNEAGELAVVGVMIQEGSENAAWSNLVDAVDGGAESFSTGDLASLLPSDRSYFTYPGSLTTPPCSEGVRWIVLEEPVSMSAEQLALFREAHGQTDRPTQPLEGRQVRFSGD